jgi:hypothetical protein
MKIKAIHILLIVLTITAGIFIFYRYHHDGDSYNNATINEDISIIQNFSVESNSTNLSTSVEGTIFVSHDDKEIPSHIQIVAWIEIDPNDWGGVSFFIPKKWNVSNISSSYPYNEDMSIPKDNISILNAHDTKMYEWHQFIEIGRNHNYMPSEGGTGTIVIDLYPDKDSIEQTESFNITVAVGSKEKDGVKVIGTDSTSIDIP